MNHAAVIMYHAIEDDKNPAGAENAGEQLYVLHREQFHEQMAYLHSEGYKTFLFEELFRLQEWPHNAIVISFDDGHESNLEIALPILQEYGFKAEFFITTGWIGTPNYLSAAQIVTLHDAGMGIGSHGVSHRYLDDLDDNEIRFELQVSKDVLSGITGGTITSFAVPGGRIKPEVADVAKQIDYRIVCTSQPGILCQRRQIALVPRLALRCDTELKTFRAMVKGDGTLIRMLRLRHKLLRFAKIILGNWGYEQVRGIVLRFA